MYIPITRLAAASDKVYQLLAMVGGSFRVLRLLPPPKPGRHDIAEKLLKVALNTKNQSINHSYYNRI